MVSTIDALLQLESTEKFTRFSCGYAYLNGVQGMAKAIGKAILKDNEFTPIMREAT